MAWRKEGRKFPHLTNSVNGDPNEKKKRENEMKGKWERKTNQKEFGGKEKEKGKKKRKENRGFPGIPTVEARRSEY